jgi:hypothetical protein
MSSLILPRRFTQQPQGAVEVADSLKNGSIFLLNPALSQPNRHINLVGKNPITVVGTTPTAGNVITPIGKGLQFHPAGGSNGIPALSVSATALDITKDLTYFWIGYPSNVTGTCELLARGTESGNWSINFGISSTTRVYATYVDNPPTAGYTAALTSQSFAIGKLAAVAYRRSANVISVFDGVAKGKASTTGTNAGFRNTTNTLVLGGGGVTSTPSLHAKTVFAFAVNYDIPDGEVFSILANPWQIFKPRKSILYFDAPSFPVLSSLTASYITSSGGRLTAN